MDSAGTGWAVTGETFRVWGGPRTKTGFEARVGGAIETLERFFTDDLGLKVRAQQDLNWNFSIQPQGAALAVLGESDRGSGVAFFTTTTVSPEQLQLVLSKGTKVKLETKVWAGGQEWSTVIHLNFTPEQREKLLVWLDEQTAQMLSGLGATTFGGHLGTFEVKFDAHTPAAFVTASLWVPTTKSRVHKTPQVKFEFGQLTSLIDIDSSQLRLNRIPLWNPRSRATKHNAVWFSLVRPAELQVKLDEVLSANPNFKGDAVIKKPRLINALKQKAGAPVVEIVEKEEERFEDRLNNPFLRYWDPKKADYSTRSTPPWDPNGLNMLYFRSPSRSDQSIHTKELLTRAKKGEPLLVDVDARKMNYELLDSSYFLILDMVLYYATSRFHKLWWDEVDRNPALVEAVKAQDWARVRVSVDEVLSQLPPLMRGTPFSGIKDLPEGQPVPDDEEERDFSAMLTEEQRAAGLQLTTSESKHKDGRGELMFMLYAYLTKDGKTVGRIVGAVRSNGYKKFVAAEDVRLQPEFRGKGLGQKMYEALYRRGYELGATEVKGGVHSAAADAVHNALANKHGWNYFAYQMDEEDDDLFSPYEYQLTGGLGTYRDERTPWWFGLVINDFEYLEVKDAQGKDQVPYITIIHASVGGPNQLLWISFASGFQTQVAKVSLAIDPAFRSTGKFEGENIRFKLKPEALQKLSVWLDEQEERGALFGTFKRTAQGVTLDKKPTKEMTSGTVPDENIIWYGPMGAAASFFLGLPANSFMVYVFDTAKNKEAYTAELKGGAQPLMYKVQRGGLLQPGQSAIDEIFDRAPKGLIAVYRVAAARGDDDDESWKNIIYVDMMSVREKWQRQGINTMMMNTFKAEWPGREVKFSSPTHKGAAFMKARGFSGPTRERDLIYLRARGALGPDTRARVMQPGWLSVRAIASDVTQWIQVTFHPDKRTPAIHAATTSLRYEDFMSRFRAGFVPPGEDFVTTVSARWVLMEGRKNAATAYWGAALGDNSYLHLSLAPSDRDEILVWLDQMFEEGKLRGVQQSSVGAGYHYITFDKVTFVPTDTMRNWNARQSSRKTTFSIQTKGSPGFETSIFCVEDHCWYVSQKLFKDLMLLAEGTQPIFVANQAFAMQLKPEDRAPFVIWLRQVVEQNVFYQGKKLFNEESHKRFLVWCDSVLEKTSVNGVSP